MEVIVIAGCVKGPVVACSARGWSFSHRDSDLPKENPNSIAHLSGVNVGFDPRVVSHWLSFMTKIPRLLSSLGRSTIRTIGP